MSNVLQYTYGTSANGDLSRRPSMNTRKTIFRNGSVAQPAFQALEETWLSIIGADWNEQSEYIIDSCESPEKFV